MTIDKKIFSKSVTELNEKLFEELLDEHLGLKRAYYHKDYEKVLIKGGKFAETVFQILEDLHTGSYSERPNFKSLQESLESSDSNRYPGSVRITIPRAAINIYDIRSNRGGAHKSEIDSQYIDATFCLNVSNWIVSELARLYSDMEPKRISEVINRAVTQSLPFVEEFENGDVMILVETDSCRDECLLLLYHFYPTRITNQEMREYLDHQSAPLVLNSLKRAKENKLVHRNEDGNMLTRKGIRYVEKKFG